MNIKSEQRTVEIVRNGDSFLLRESVPSFIDAKMETKNIPATLKDGTLQMQTGFGVSTLAIDKSTGRLTDGQSEYKHAN